MGRASDRWTKHAPAGSVWTENRGCGVSCERPDGTQRLSGLCGAAHVPELAQRFLHFYTEAELHGA